MQYIARGGTGLCSAFGGGLINTPTATWEVSDDLGPVLGSSVTPNSYSVSYPNPLISVTLSLTAPRPSSVGGSLFGVHQIAPFNFVNAQIAPKEIYVADILTRLTTVAGVPTGGSWLTGTEWTLYVPTPTTGTGLQIAYPGIYVAGVWEASTPSVGHCNLAFRVNDEEGDPFTLTPYNGNRPYNNSFAELSFDTSLGGRTYDFNAFLRLQIGLGGAGWSPTGPLSVPFGGGAAVFIAVGCPVGAYEKIAYLRPTTTGVDTPFLNETPQEYLLRIVVYDASVCPVPPEFPELCSGPVIVPPAPVVVPEEDGNLSCCSIVFTWDAYTPPGGISVVRTIQRLNSAGLWQTIATLPIGTLTYTDSTVREGARYQYKFFISGDLTGLPTYVTIDSACAGSWTRDCEPSTSNWTKACAAPRSWSKC